MTTESQKFMQDLKTGVRYVVINDCYGGFGLSDLARDEYKQFQCIHALKLIQTNGYYLRRSSQKHAGYLMLLEPQQLNR